MTWLLTIFFKSVDTDFSVVFWGELRELTVLTLAPLLSHPTVTLLHRPLKLLLGRLVKISNFCAGIL